MPTRLESQLGRGEQRQLNRARANGFLDTRGPAGARAAKAYGLWCWRLRIPMIWCERPKPRSRYGSVRLDMLTTPNALTAAGQAALRALCGSFQVEGEARVTADDAAWDSVPAGQLASLAAAALKAALHTGHSRLNRTRAAKTDAAPRRDFKVVARRTA